MASSSIIGSVLNFIKNHVVFEAYIAIFPILVLLWVWKSEGTTTGEPPVARTKIPLIGHFIGFQTHHIKYLEILRRQLSSVPAYTIKFFSRRTYVITSPSLSHIALRSKTLSLEPLSARIAGPLLGISKDAIRSLGIGDNGHWIGSTGMAERRVDFNKRLAPGAELSDMGTKAAAEIAEVVNEIETDWKGEDLFKWLRDTMTYATTVGLYGKYSPVAVDRSVIQDIWTFDSYQLLLTMNILPSILAPKGLQARERLARAFKCYLDAGHEQYASSAVRSTIEIMRKHGVTADDHARLEIFNVSVATVNTTPTAIWMILYTLANPSLLQSLRDEIQSNSMKTLPESDEKSRSDHRRRIQIDVSRVSETCPLLHATYQEALRLGSIPTCNRSVLEDTIMTDPASNHSVLVKKGQRVVVPTFMLHSRPSIWGSDAADFSPSHFLDEGVKDERSRGIKKTRNEGFVPYGGGVHLCPGRHFAQLEILAVAALIVMALEVEMKDGTPLKVPEAAIASGALKPAVPMIVRMRRREGWQDVEWSVKA